jgi:hypothetical protein
MDCNSVLKAWSDLNTKLISPYSDGMPETEYDLKRSNALYILLEKRLNDVRAFGLESFYNYPNYSGIVFLCETLKNQQPSPGCSFFNPFLPLAVPGDSSRMIQPINRFLGDTIGSEGNYTALFMGRGQWIQNGVTTQNYIMFQRIYVDEMEFGVQKVLDRLLADKKQTFVEKGSIASSNLSITPYGIPLYTVIMSSSHRWVLFYWLWRKVYALTYFLLEFGFDLEDINVFSFYFRLTGENELFDLKLCNLYYLRNRSTEESKIIRHRRMLDKFLNSYFTYVSIDHNGKTTLMNQTLSDVTKKDGSNLFDDEFAKYEFLKNETRRPYDSRKEKIAEEPKKKVKETNKIVEEEEDYEEEEEEPKPKPPSKPKLIRLK